jgi:hypothetical protein
MHKLSCKLIIVRKIKFECILDREKVITQFSWTREMWFTGSYQRQNVKRKICLSAGLVSQLLLHYYNLKMCWCHKNDVVVLKFVLFWLWKVFLLSFHPKMLRDKAKLEQVNLWNLTSFELIFSFKCILNKFWRKLVL